MSEENFEVVMETFRRFRPGDLEEWAAMFEPEAVVTPPDGWPEPGPFVGREALIRQWERLFADWAEFRFENFEVAAESDEWVVFTFRMHARGETSGLDADFDFAVASRIRDGLTAESHFRWELDDAIEAAGLSE
ncbi:MAG TPA: nuclear transport factor 2 family protein [Solirubrobacterales bacterium]|nr:nuclear transport factor 2 family protein [Solirubrobacterales bacterium]